MNWWLVSPELALAITTVALVLVDLVVSRKGVLAVLAGLGLLVSIGLSLALWGEETTALNGMLVVDPFALFFKLFFPAVAFLVVLSSADYVSRFARFQGEYYALLLLATIGMMLLASTGELISIYISLELMSLSLYTLAGFLKDEKSGEAGLKYLLLGAVASAVLLYGMALTFGITGTTHLDGVRAAVMGIGSPAENPALVVAVILLMAGFGFKIASVPFQMWVPDVYEGAPTPVTAFLAVASKAAGFAIILRLFSVAFGAPDWLTRDWGMLFAVLSAVTMTLGNIIALAQTNIKRLLGYSSIAHAGYIMMGLAALGLAGGEGLGRSGVLFYLGAYGVTTLGAFIAVIAISHRLDSDQIADYAGMARRAPLLAAALGLSLVSLTGFPITAGFWAKIYIFNAALQEGLLWLVVVAVLNTAISAYYYLGVVKRMYLAEAPSPERVPAALSVRASLALCSLGVLLFGALPASLLRLAEAAVRLIS